MSGYLKAVKTENIKGKLNCELKIPNEEVHIFYENLIEKWFIMLLSLGCSYHFQKNMRLDVTKGTNSSYYYYI